MQDRGLRRRKQAKEASGSTADGNVTTSRSAETNFAKLFAAHAPLLRAIAGGVLGRPDLLEDVLQESAVIAIQKFDTFDPETSFAAWMGRIVRFTALNVARRVQRSRRRAAGPEAIDRASASTAEMNHATFDETGRIVVGREEFDQRVLDALGSLDEVARICLLLRVLHQTPYRDISLILDIPEGTAMSHVHRSRRALREILAGEDLAGGEGGNRP